MSNGLFPEAAVVYATGSAFGASNVSVDDGAWTTVASVGWTAVGGTTLRIAADLALSVGVGGACRIVIDGGTFSDTLVTKGEATLPPSEMPLMRNTGTTLPSGETAYTLKLQIKNEGVLSVVTYTAANARHRAFVAFAEFKTPS